MALLIVEFYEDVGDVSVVADKIYGHLIASTEDSTLTTTVEHATKPGNATYCSVATDTAAYVEIGAGSQDAASGRRMLLLANERRDFVLSRTDTTVTYRSVV